MRVRIALLSAIGVAASAAADVRTPVLLWKDGGCTSYCPTGWYSSPAVVDVDGDGVPEVIAGAYSVVVLDPQTGITRHTLAESARVWADIAVADLAHDGNVSAVAGFSDGKVYVLDATLAARAGWPVTLFGGHEPRALALGDLDANGRYAIVAGDAAGVSTGQVDVRAANGTERAGWPRMQAGDSGYGAGIYNDNIAIADLNGAGRPQIFVPSDVHYMMAFNADGSQVAANLLFGNPAKVWSQVGVYVDQAYDIQGYGPCGSVSPTLRPNFNSSAPAVGDVNGDGKLELAVVGDVYDCTAGDSPAADVYHLPMLFNGDRTRFSAGGADWTTFPAPSAGSAPLSEDYNVIQSAQPNAVLADLDGDGAAEFLYSSYDGKVHAYWLDKTEHGNWPFAIPGSGFHFASPPVVAELYHDGKIEILFATWPENSATENGKLYILDAQANVLQAVDLPPPLGGSTWNGGLASPTLAILPGSRDMAVVLNTWASGVVAYDLPGTAYARTLWPTGRGGYLRNGRAFNDRVFADDIGG